MSFPTTGLGLPWLLLSTPTPPPPRATEHTAGYSQVSAESPVLPPMASPTTASPNPQVLLGVMLRRSYLLMVTSWCPAWFPTSPRASPPSCHPRMLGSLVSPAWLHGSTRAKSHGEVFYKRGVGVVARGVSLPWWGSCRAAPVFRVCPGICPSAAHWGWSVGQGPP